MNEEHPESLSRRPPRARVLVVIFVALICLALLVSGLTIGALWEQVKHLLQGAREFLSSNFLLVLILVIAGLPIAYWALFPVKSPPWAGFGEQDVEEKTTTVKDNNGNITTESTKRFTKPRKTLWDWLSLLIIPLTLAIASFLLSEAQARRQNDLETRRALSQAAVEANRVNANALQAYYDKMSDLLLVRNLRGSAAGAEVRSIARSTTLATLRGLDPERKASLLLFLYESALIGGVDEEGNHQASIVSLTGADLHGASLHRATLSGANLSGAILDGAKLSLADLGETNLSDAILYEAILFGANLSGADLTGANLFDTDLREASLSGANLRGANLDGAMYSTLTIWARRLRPGSGRGRKSRLARFPATSPCSGCLSASEGLGHPLRSWLVVRHSCGTGVK